MTSSDATAPPIFVSEATESMYLEDKPFFYIGHHEAERAFPNADYALQEAQDVGVSIK